MNAKLFVGGVSFQTDDDTFRAAFEEVGEVVDASIVRERDTGRSRGFGFVTMATPELAQAAIERWDGQELDGREVSVSEARSKEE